ncbi:MAG: transposase [Rhodobacteraceae bacterium]|nr:transposase [Paracoccaceae bacterium]
MAGKKGQKKRVWSDDEKRSICEQTTTAGVSVEQVARRYSMNANLIFKWLKDPRFAPDLEKDAAQPEDGVVAFLPVEVRDPLPVDLTQTGAQPLSSAAISAHRVDITLSDGRRILVEGPTALSAILGLVQGLMA